MSNGAQLDFFFSFTWGPLPMGWCQPHSGLNPCRNSLIDIPCPEGCLLAEFPLHRAVNHLYINTFHRLDVTQLHTCGTTCLPQKSTDASVSFIYNQRNAPNDTIPNSLSVSSPNSLGNCGVSSLDWKSRGGKEQGQRGQWPYGLRDSEQ